MVRGGSVRAGAQGGLRPLSRRRFPLHKRLLPRRDLRPPYGTGWDFVRLEQRVLRRGVLRHRAELLQQRVLQRWLLPGFRSMLCGDGYLLPGRTHLLPSRNDLLRFGLLSAGRDLL